MASAAIDTIIEQIQALKAMEIVDLVKRMEDVFEVSAQAPVAVAAAAPGDAAAGPAAEEKTKFTVVLKDGGAKKIAVIKAVRALNSTLGLKEAKELVEAGGKAVVSDVSKEEA